MITDASAIFELKCLQEVYLSHNLLSSLLIKYSENHEIIWPYLEVFDLTFNKLNDFYEILQIVNGTALRKEILKILALKGNSFYNYQENGIK